MRILLIDDSRSIERITRKFLEIAQIHVDELAWAGSAARGEELLGEASFDLVFVDNKVPPYTKASEYAPQLRETYDIPCMIVLSGVDSVGRPSWADDVWSKHELSPTFMLDRLGRFFETGPQVFAAAVGQ